MPRWMLTTSCRLAYHVLLDCLPRHVGSLPACQAHAEVSRILHELSGEIVSRSERSEQPGARVDEGEEGGG